MATIQDYLNLIKNAIYGKDVRQAIHDGIQQCYYDGKAGSTDLEARQRLDAYESNISSIESDISLLDERIDQIVAPSGEAPSAAEVSDGRVGADGITYTSLGESVRTQFFKVKNDLRDKNARNLVLDGNTQNLTHNSSTFTWDTERKKVTVVCTASTHSASLFNIYYSPASLPNGFVAGRKYYVNFSSTASAGQRVVWDMYIYLSDNTQIQYATQTSDLTFVLPSNAIGIHFRLRVMANYKVNEVITIELMNAKTNLQLEADTDDAINSMKDNSAYNVLKLGDQQTLTNNSTTFTWSDKEHCHVVCSASTHNAAQSNIFYSIASLPNAFEAGKRYYLKYLTSQSSGQRCLCDILIFRNGNVDVNNPDVNIYTNKNAEIDIPSDATGIIVRLRLIANYVVEEDIYIRLLSAKTNAELEESISNVSPYYGLTDYVYSGGTHNGVTYTWNDDKNSVHVAGTASGSSFRNVYYDTARLPLGLKAGDKYGVLYNSTDEHIACRITYQLEDGTNSYSPYFTEPTILTIPNNAVGMFIRINVVSGYTVDGYATVPLLFKVQTQSEHIPFKAKKPLMVSFIDDDTSTDELVRRFYQNCKHNGIVGNFAVCTKQYVNGDSHISELLSYEYDGFNLIPHCYEQKTYLQPESEDYDIVQARENYFQCLRDFITLGIRNPQNLWIIPYGSQDEVTANLAKDLGFDMAFTTLGLVNNYLTWNNKFGMHRCGLSALADVTDDTSASATGSMAKCKARIDELVASETGGWAIFTTHFNEWDSETWDSTLDGNGYPVGYSRFNELVQYAIDSGCDIVSMAQGAAYMKPIIDRNFTMG